MAIYYQIFVKNLDGCTLSLQIPSPAITGEALLRHLSLKTDLPLPSFRLISGTREITNQTLISSDDSHFYPSISLLPRLRGGKGGFGSLLRGAASKAGQKKTSNFDACRDLNGRRLRHVNAEKKMEEWKAGEKDRKLEKLGEDFLKKKAKEAKKTSGAEVEKSLQKYEEDSKKCVQAIEESVQQYFALYKNGKRKDLPGSDPNSSKKLKLWVGKKALDSDTDSDSDSDSDPEEEEDSKSVIMEEGNSSGQSGEIEEENALHYSCALGPSTNGEESSGTGSLETISEEVTDKKSCDTGSQEKISQEKMANKPCIVEADIGSGFGEFEKKEELSTVEMVGPVMGEMESTDKANNVVDSMPEVANKPKLDASLNFDDYDSALDLEALGLERLKTELQKNGLKCGGTVQERASRLFLLKTTPFDKLPKKVLAKK